jgi:hypothetical protein
MLSGQRSVFARALMQSVRGVALLALVLIVGYFLVSKSQMSDSKVALDANDDPKAAKAAGPKPDEAIVKLDSEAQEKGGIETAAPREITYQGRARAYGVILPLDRLTGLYNSALTATLQFKSAEIKLEASKTANARAQNLLKLFPSSASQAELADATYKMDAAAVEAAQAQLEAARNAAIQEWGPVLGQAIVERSELAEQLVRHKIRLIQLTLQPGAVAEAPEKISVTFGGSSTAEADFISEATQADPKIPNVSFFYTIPGAPGALAGLTVAAMFPNGEARPGVDIPPSAIIWQAGRPWMYVQAGSDKFERRAIGEEAAPTADGGYVLPAASWPHDKLVVVAGAQTLLSEESKNQMQPDEDDN